MAKKSDRAIVEPVTVGDKTYKPGMEAELVDAGVPKWNLDQMQAKGWLSGDWSAVGLTPEEEAEVVAETVAAAPVVKKPRGR